MILSGLCICGFCRAGRGRASVLSSDYLCYVCYRSELQRKLVAGRYDLHKVFTGHCTRPASSDEYVLNLDLYPRALEDKKFRGGFVVGEKFDVAHADTEHEKVPQAQGQAQELIVHLYFLIKVNIEKFI